MDKQFEDWQKAEIIEYLTRQCQKINILQAENEKLKMQVRKWKAEAKENWENQRA